MLSLTVLREWRESERIIVVWTKKGSGSKREKKEQTTRARRLFPFRKQSLPFLTADAIIGNQAFSMIDVIYAQNFNKIRQKPNL